MEPAPLVLLAAAWGGSWTWDLVCPRLRDLGVPVHTVELTSVGDDPAELGDLYSDAAALRGAIDACERPAVVCGFSYGGMVVTEAAAGPYPNVARVVYLAAEVGDVGDTTFMTMTAGKVDADYRPGSAPTPFADEEMVVFMRGAFADPRGGAMGFHPEVMAEALERGGLSPDAAIDFARRNRLMNPLATMQPLTGAGWRDIPSTYLLCTRDETGVGNHRRMGALCSEMIELPTGHFPMFTDPALLAETLADIACAAADERG